METPKGTIIELPKGTVVMNVGGGFEQGGTTARLAESAKVEFDRNLEKDELASLFVAGNRKELLPLLTHKEDGKQVVYSRQGERIVKGAAEDAQNDADAPELARRARQRIEDDRLAEQQKAFDAANEKAARENEALQNKIDNARVLDSRKSADDKAAAIDRDLRAKAAVADDETVKDDIERATTEGKTPLEIAERAQGLEVEADLKTAPEKVQLDREAEAVEKIGIKNAATAKADFDATDLNEVTHKDGTNKDITLPADPDKKQAVETVDEMTDRSIREAKTEKKNTDADRKDTESAEAALKAASELREKAKKQFDPARREAAENPTVADETKSADGMETRAAAQAELVAASEAARAKAAADEEKKAIDAVNKGKK